MDKRKRLGQFGEDVAANYLARRGHRIVARGWRCALGEIDLVTQDGAELVFVEVRTRRAAPAGMAEASVGAAKRSKLVRLAYTYLATGGEDSAWRIDVIAVALDAGGKVTHITHIPSAVSE